MTEEQKRAVELLRKKIVEREPMRGRILMRWEVEDIPPDIDVIFHTSTTQRGLDDPDRRRSYFRISADGAIGDESVLYLDLRGVWRP